MWKSSVKLEKCWILEWFQNMHLHTNEERHFPPRNTENGVVLSSCEHAVKLWHCTHVRRVTRVPALHDTRVCSVLYTRRAVFV